MQEANSNDADDAEMRNLVKLDNLISNPQPLPNRS